MHRQIQIPTKGKNRKKQLPLYIIYIAKTKNIFKSCNFKQKITNFAPQMMNHGESETTQKK